MGDPDAADPTELAPNETATASAQAWGLADYDDEAPTTRLTSGRITGAAVAVSLVAVAVAGLVAWQHLRGEDKPVAPSMVPATPMTTVVPVAEQAPPPSPTVVTITTVIKQVPPGWIPTAEKPAPMVPDTSALDRRFIASLQAKGWSIWDPASSVQRAHQVCAQFQQHATMAQIMSELRADAVAEGIPSADATAEQFAYTVLETYPCERR